MKQPVSVNHAPRDRNMFRDYGRQSFIDSLTLYLHGICCDIDVETGPRQLASRYLRKRLQVLAGLSRRPTATRFSPKI